MQGTKEEHAMKETDASREVMSRDEFSRARRIRAGLPGQMLRERIEMARVGLGPLYTMAEIRRKVADSLPHRLGFLRGAVLEPIETYQGFIPDEVLLKYDDAARTELFDKFWVVTPTYYQERQLDPWVIGKVAGADLCAVIAQWDG